MRPTLALRMYTAQLTLFTKANCGLCDTAKSQIQEVLKRRTVEYTEVDIDKPENKKWRDQYVYDIPVLHIERVMHTYSKPNIVTEAKKVFHRIDQQKLEEMIDETEQVVA